MPFAGAACTCTSLVLPLFRVSAVQEHVDLTRCPPRVPTRFLEAADNKAKIWVVRLVTSLLQSACPPKVPESTLVGVLVGSPV